MNRLAGKVALISGGASGIGARTAALFVAEGCRVMIADMQEERGRALAAELGREARFAPVDVSRERQVRAAIDACVDAFGRLDCIFNNAGLVGAMGPIAETEVEEFDLAFSVLLRGVFLGIKHAAPVMIEQGAGSIINTASVAGLQGGIGPHTYSAAKAAVIALSRSVALELAEHQVRVNCIAPGYIGTPLATNSVGQPESVLEERKQRFASAQPIPRVGEPQDIAQAALWLASEDSSFVTGETLVVDGGLTLGRPWQKQPAMMRKYAPARVYRPSE